MNNIDISAERSSLRLARSSLLSEANYIAGRWVDANEVIAVVNPATGGVLAHVPRLGATEASRAVDAASNAFPSWRARPAKERSNILRRWYELIVEHSNDLARLMTAEQGKPLAEAKAEIAYAAAYVEWFAEEAKRIYGDTIPGHQTSKRLVVIKQPVGVVAAITPWNFPAAMITRKVAPALAVGCTIVLKPSELTPLSALALAVLGEEAGIPAGVFNVITGDPPAIGDVLCSDARVRKLTFTGSTPVGKLLAARCMSTVKHVTLELGGNAPFIVFDDADIERAVEGAMASKFRNTGQTCVCANRFLIHADIYQAFSVRLRERAAALKIGDGLVGETQQGPLINEAAVRKVETHVCDALQHGARLLTGGTRQDAGGLFYLPTVLSEVAPGSLSFREETFGPVAALIRFTTEAEAIRLANDTSAGLAAYLYTNNVDRAQRVSEALEYGMVGLNTGMISTEVAPFGGIKESGFGREGSYYGTADYLETKLICSDVSLAR